MPKIPKSYALELLTIYAWERAGKPNEFRMEQGLKCILESLVDYKDINISWTEYYSEEERVQYSNGTHVYGKYVNIVVKHYRHICTSLRLHVPMQATLSRFLFE